ncbi:uncharacterized protein LOC116260951 [Nymphaea colorata]|nr:uncharacterized protein LOC116260951 [Nymphaea colorata]
MENQNAVSAPKFPVKVKLHLGSESFHVNVAKGLLSTQLSAMKEESMTILKDYITKHNVPNDVPDEVLESTSEDEDVAADKPAESRKRK